MFDCLDEFEGEQNLVQLVNFDTWRRVVRGDLKSSRLDLVYENVHGLVKGVEEISTSTSDHTPILNNLTMKVPTKTEKKIIRNWSAYSKEKLLVFRHFCE